MQLLYICRYYAIAAPLHYAALVSPRRVAVGLAASWTGALLLCLPPFSGLVPPYRFVYTHIYIYVYVSPLTTITIAIAFRCGVAFTILLRDCCIFSHNERDSIYFVQSVSRLAQVVLHCIKARCETISVPALSESKKELNLIHKISVPES